MTNLRPSGCLPGEANVFDSMPSADLPKRKKEQIASIIYALLSINLFQISKTNTSG